MIRGRFAPTFPPCRRSARCCTARWCSRRRRPPRPRQLRDAHDRGPDIVGGLPTEASPTRIVRLGRDPGSSTGATTPTTVGTASASPAERRNDERARPRTTRPFSSPRPTSRSRRRRRTGSTSSARSFSASSSISSVGGRRSRATGPDHDVTVTDDVQQITRKRARCRAERRHNHPATGSADPQARDRDHGDRDHDGLRRRGSVFADVRRSVRERVVSQPATRAGRRLQRDAPTRGCRARDRDAPDPPLGTNVVVAEGDGPQRAGRSRSPNEHTVARSRGNSVVVGHHTIGVDPSRDFESSGRAT